MKEKRGLTPTGDKWARKLLNNGIDFTAVYKDDGNPFFHTVEGLRMRFDLIVLVPGADGGVVVQYCYKGEHICTFPVDDMELVYSGKGKENPLLNLEGITGSMAMEIIVG